MKSLNLVLSVLTTSIACGDLARPTSCDAAPPIQGHYGTYVETGSNALALVYYEETLTVLGLNPNHLTGQTLVDTQTLSGMMAYLGYGALEAVDVQKLPSTVLENYSLLRAKVSHPTSFQAAFDSAGIQNRPNMRSTRYFSPKITDVADDSTGASKPHDKVDFGWRKLVRFVPSDGSPAKAHGVTQAYLLFNIFQGDLPRDQAAFDHNESVNTQLILERDNTPANPLTFFVYGRLSQGGKLITFLTASFDARSPSVNPTHQYFVPHACAECHGGLRDGNSNFKMRLNFIDTDHIFDRLLRPNDFVDLIYTQHGALFDVGKLPGQDSDLKKEQQSAFESIQFINSGIETQNRQVDGGDPPAFQTLAAHRWNALHKGWGDPELGRDVSRWERAGLFDRVISTDPNTPVWNAADPVDFELLPLLNQYCYRCHSQLRFTIFDKGAVVGRKDRIDTYLSSTFMPQDRILSDAVKGRLRDLVAKLK